VKIAINTRFLLSDKLEGFGRFTDEICKRLVLAHPEHDFYFLFDRPFDKKFIYADNVHPVVLRPPARHPILFYIWFEISVRRFLKKLNPDLFLSPDGHLSLKWPGKQIAVIHDLNFEHYPQDLPKSPRNYLLKYFPLFAQRADRIVTVSEFSKSDIIKQYNIPKNNIDVVYNAADEGFKPISEDEKHKVRLKFSSGQPYFVYVGSLHPRKNIHRLFMAFDHFKAKTQSPLKLIIVGDEYWFNDSMKSSFDTLSFKSDIIFTGHLLFEEMTKVLASAKALCYLSYFEGFGIPIIEAMMSGVPVICGDRTSLPEVAGEAAIVVDPFSIEAITTALIHVNEDSELCTQLILKGYLQAQRFNWNSSAEALWNSILKTID